jgi:hypothetical protein
MTRAAALCMCMDGEGKAVYRSGASWGRSSTACVWCAEGLTAEERVVILRA